MCSGGSCTAALSVLLIRGKKLNITGLHEKEAYNVSGECSKEIFIEDTPTFFSNVSRTDSSRLR